MSPRPERPDLTAQRAELTMLIGTISMRSERLGDLLGTLLSYVPIQDWAALEADLRREFDAAPAEPPPSIDVPDRANRL